MKEHQVARANRYLNLVRNKGLREYGWAYLSWLRNGGVGIEPACRSAARQRVRAKLLEILGPAPFAAAGGH